MKRGGRDLEDVSNKIYSEYLGKYIDRENAVYIEAEDWYVKADEATLIDEIDKGEVVSMYGKLMKHRPDASFKELRTAYTAGEVYVSSKDMLLLNDKAVVTKGVRI